MNVSFILLPGYLNLITKPFHLFILSIPSLWDSDCLKSKKTDSVITGTVLHLVAILWLQFWIACYPRSPQQLVDFRLLLSFCEVHLVCSKVARVLGGLRVYFKKRQDSVDYIGVCSKFNFGHFEYNSFFQKW